MLEGVEMPSNTAGSVAGRESDLVAASERPSASAQASTEERYVL